MEKHVLIPTLKKIEVNNYSLFNSNWQYEVKSGLNLFIGVNGLGKTTTTSLIIYGIAGFTGKLDKEEYKIDESYFIERESSPRSDDPELLIEFKVANNYFKVKRKLNKDLIVSYELNGTKREVENYVDDLLSLSFISKIEDLAFLLEKFLIREEEANYLLWDFKEQSKLLQILISPVGFKKDYQIKSERLSKLTSDINREKDSKISAYRKRINDIHELKLKNSSKAQKADNLIKQSSSLKRKIKEHEAKRKSKMDAWKNAFKQLTKINILLEKVNSEIEILNDQIIDVEKSFYENVYSDEKVMTAIHKLKSYSNCIYCNSQLTKVIKERILESVKEEKCPVCTTSFESRTNKDYKSISYTIDDLKKFEKNLSNLNEKKIEVSKRKEDINKAYINHKEEIDQLNRLIDDLNINLLEADIVLQDNNNDKEYSQYDIEIKSMQEAIAEVEAKIKPKEIEAKTLSKELEKANNSLSTRVSNNLTSINNYFKNLSKKYFRDDCELIIEQKQLKKSNNFQNIRQAHYIPSFDGKKRTLKKHCSTSQRFFLEYLFRLSLLKLYNEITKDAGTSFAIFETAEGAFDLKFTEKLADTFIDYSKSTETPLILITNLSKPPFVKKLKDGLENKANILNYIEFGNLSLSDKLYYGKIIKDFDI